jgi:ubiquinol-cytochrome c reductase cytochrome c subunit
MSTPVVRARTHLFAVAGAIAIAVGVASPLAVRQASAPTQRQPSPDGTALYATSCSSCHGTDGKGTSDGPTLLDEGPAAVDWVLRTGRMPLHAPGDQAVARSKPSYDRAQIDAIISYLRSLGMKGPAIPEVDLSGADIVNGGEIFSRNCASCHQAVAQGGAVNGGRDAPSLQSTDALTIAEVLRVGPGVMPNFSGFDRAQVADVSAWVTQVGQKPDDRGGAGIGHIGPIAEGLVIWLVIAVGALGALRWIGDKTPNQLGPGLTAMAVAPRPGTAERSTADPVSAAGIVDEKKSSTSRFGSWLVLLTLGGVLVVQWMRNWRNR